MTTKPKIGKVVRVDNLKLPRKILHDDFEEICKTYQFPSSRRNELEEFFDNIVKEFIDWMNEDRRKPPRSSDRDHLKKVLSDIETATKQIDKLGPSGRLALPAIATIVAPMLSARWINLSFPDSNYAPGPVSIPEMGWGGPEYFIEEELLEQRAQFVSHEAVRTTIAALKTIGEGIKRALQSLDRQPGSKGGRKPIIYRHFLLINLAVKWGDMGKELSTGPKSDFPAFCESVAEAIGWPTEGLSSAIPDAISEARVLLLNAPVKKR